MRCPNCGKSIPDNVNFCGFCGADATGGNVGRKNRKPPHRRWLILIILVLVVAIIIASIVLVSLLRSNSGKIEQRLVADQQILLSGNFTDRKVTDQASALAAIGDVADVLGIADVDSAFGQCVENTYSKSSYYRFYQEYMGIPVYGRSVVISADSSGNTQILAGNYLTLDNLKTETLLDAEQAIQVVEQEYGSDCYSFCEGLVIYSLHDNKPELAWQIYVSSDDLAEDCFVSVNSGKIICENSLIYTDTVIGTGQDIDNVEQQFNTLSENSVYYLEDEYRNISVNNANNGTLKYRNIIVDSRDNVYEYDEKRLCFVNTPVDSNEPISFEDRGGNSELDFYTGIAIYDSKGNLIDGNAKIGYALYTNNIITDVYRVESPSTYWSDKKAVTAMSRVSAAVDFYEDVFGRHGFNDQTGTTMVSYNNFNGFDTSNAWSQSLLLSSGKSMMTLLFFGTDSTISYDLVGHEYTHSVESAISGMQYSSESGALMEAYSDIFGELFEDWASDGELDGSCDWIHNANSDYPRDLTNPAAYKKPGGGSYPSIYQDGNWYDTTATDINHDYGGVHTNNTVISHAAYNMIRTDQTMNSQPLSQNNMAQLFYRTLFLLPSDCTFEEFANLLSETARIMREERVITGRQLARVWRSISDAGLSNANASRYASALHTNLTILDFKGEVYTDYELRVEHESGNENESIETYISGNVIANGLSFPEAGTYEITITDKNNQNNVTSFTIIVRDYRESDNLTLHTNCGTSNLDDLVDLPGLNGDEEQTAHKEKRLLAVKTYSESEYYTSLSEVNFDYDDNGLLIRSTHNVFIDGNSTDGGYDYIYTYDDAGRVISRYYYVQMWESGFENVTRSYNSEGLLISDEYHGEAEVSKEREFTYNEDGQLIWEHVMVGNSGMMGTVEKEYSYSYYTDELGNLIGVRHNETDPVAGDVEFVYDADGKLVEGYDDSENGGQIKFDDEYVNPYFLIRDAEETIIYPSGESEPWNWRKAIILDSASQEIESFWIGSPETAQMTYDEDGYPIKVVYSDTYYDYRVEFIYGDSETDSISSALEAEKGNDDPVSEQDVSAQVNILSFPEALWDDWTDGNLEYRIFGNETFEYNVASIANDQVITRVNIQSGVVEITGANTANLYSDPELLSWMELKYDSQTDTIYVGNDTHPYYRLSNWISGNTPDVVYADVPRDENANYYGDNIIWTLEDGVLTLTGVGKMENFTKKSFIPWYDECKKITSVIVEEGITSVGNYAFDECKKLTSVTLPDTIRSIGECAFWKCSSLTSIVIPDGCTTINASAFNWCENLKSVTLPATITTIDWNAFDNCEELRNIYYGGTEAQWNRIDISSIGNKMLDYVTIHYNSAG